MTPNPTSRNSKALCGLRSEGEGGGDVGSIPVVAAPAPWA